MEESITRIAALGRKAQLGDIIDSRSESFVCNRLSGSDKFAISQQKVDGDRFQQIRFANNDSLAEKFYLLGVDGDLRLKILSDLIKDLPGSAGYLKDDKAHKLACLYQINTQIDTLDISSFIGLDRQGVLGYYSPSLTGYIVVGIEWGASCVVTCEDDFEDDELIGATEEIDESPFGMLQKKIELKLLDFCNVDQDSCKGNGSRKHEEKTKVFDKCKFSTFCDLREAAGKIHEHNMDDAIDTVRQINQDVMEINGGKGIPIYYLLLPISEVLIKKQKEYRELCEDVTTEIEGIDMETHSCRESEVIDEGTTREIIEKMENYLLIEHIYNDIHSDSLTSEKIRKESAKVFENFKSAKENWKRSLRDILCTTNDEISEALQKLNKEDNILDFEFQKVKVVFDKIEKAIEQKLCMMRYFSNEGINYLGRDDSLEKTLSENKNIYVLYGDDFFDERTKENRKQGRTMNIFYRLIEDNKFKTSRSQFYVVDLEVRSHNQQNETIVHYIDGKQIDISNIMREDFENCYVKFRDSKICKNASSHRIILSLTCPNSFTGECEDNNVTWLCLKCKGQVEYGLKDEHFYCLCGITEKQNAEFRCACVEHGIKFIKYEMEDLTKSLAKLKPNKEINILILGETGVGKSTWINGIANYMQFDSLEQAAEQKNILAVIPSHFTHIGKKREKKLIVVGGESQNEMYDVGQSNTQQPFSYSFMVGNIFYRLIDTPGIGDTRGIEQDAKNFDNILAHLSHYNEIHGICILLTPNNSRMTTVFRFCIMELLTHLHISAAANMVFCFTNARSTFYQPGETYTVLEHLLEEHRQVEIKLSEKNTFCFDNEAFRFLACLNHGIEFVDTEKLSFSASWDKSKEETNRLIQYIETLDPHNVGSTLSLNEARSDIITLCKPLTEITIMIQKNIEAAEEKRQEILLSQESAKDLEKSLHLTGVGLDLKPLDYKRTVCTHADCVANIQVNEGGTIQGVMVEKTIYKQECHKDCYVRGIPTETVNNPGLVECEAMDYESGNCLLCHHSYRIHMHLSYELIEFEKLLIDLNVQNQMNQRLSDVEKKEQFLEDLSETAMELQNEIDKITKTTAQFGLFLTIYSITPYNDAVAAHLDMIIKTEHGKWHPDLRKIEDAKAAKTRYEKEIEIIKKAMHDGKLQERNIMKDPREIQEMKLELFKLKHNGENIQNLFKEVERNRGSKFEYQEKHIPRTEERKNVAIPRNLRSKGQEEHSSQHRPKKGVLLKLKQKLSVRTNNQSFGDTDVPRRVNEAVSKAEPSNSKDRRKGDIGPSNRSPQRPPGRGPSCEAARRKGANLNEAKRIDTRTDATWTRDANHDATCTRDARYDAEWERDARPDAEWARDARPGAAPLSMQSNYVSPAAYEDAAENLRGSIDAGKQGARGGFVAFVSSVLPTGLKNLFTKTRDNNE